MKIKYTFLKTIATMLVILVSTQLFAQGITTLGGKADSQILRIYDGPGEDDSKVHIGHKESTPPTADFKLYVGSGGIMSDAVKIAHPTSWSDFVFAEDYALRSLSEVEQFIMLNKHLPDVPSEKQIIEQRYYDQHEINKVLLQKIEELTLYVIEMQKQMEDISVNQK